MAPASSLTNPAPPHAGRTVPIYALGALALLALVGPARLTAQIEGERGIAAVASSADIQVGGIEINVTGKNAEEARAEGWKLAQRKGWEMLHGPAMGDGQIGSMVSAVVIEREQIGPRRYVATLGVIFDRSKAGQYLTGGGSVALSHSAPLLTIPVLYSGGVAQVYEVRGEWQKSWANFQATASAIDYVRPSGGGGDSLLITAGQTGRRSRLWWRNVLDQFSASDVIMPVARLQRQWPGGPVQGTFTARYGPDNKYLGSFTLTANDEKAVPAMLNQAVVQMDRLYVDGLQHGLLKPDPTLVTESAQFAAALAAIRAAIVPTKPAENTASSDDSGSNASDEPAKAAPEPAKVSTYTVQFASPDARAVDAALAAIRGAPGVQGASTTSLAIGGTSVMRVTMAGGLDDLAAALRARGWNVSGGGNAIRISQ